MTKLPPPNLGQPIKNYNGILGAAVIILWGLLIVLFILKKKGL